MSFTSRLALPLVVVALVLAGCAQGPGHTRAAGTVAGTAAGALIGAAASPCDRAGGAACGAILGLVVGTVAAEGVAQDQEDYGWCRRCGAAGAHGCCSCATACR